jgi:cephalosporin-C deacetylase-like acetyl esterase
MCAIAAVALAQGRGGRGGPQVVVTPDHADWQYAPGENVTFSIKVVKDGAPVTGQTIDWAVGPEWSEDRQPLASGTLTTEAEDATVSAGTLRVPGFLRLTATIPPEGGGFPVRGVGTAGFSPEKIKPLAVEPADFDQFWQDGKDALAKVPISPQRTPFPDKTTETVNAYQVSFQTVKGAGGRGGSRLFGILTEPKQEGKYPALLRVPGAGVYGVSGIWKESYDNAIVLSIGIHGVPLNLETSVYQNLGAGPLDTYWGFNLDNKDLYYYRRVYLGCLRAVDYLASLPNWDGKTIVVVGGSQGGALAIVTAALDSRVKALGAFHPALADITAYASGRVGGWPELFRNPANRTKEKLETASYYDVVNFARRVKAPGIYSWGYNDETCMPTSTYAAYNTITAPKTLTLQLETGHFILPEQSERVNAWIREVLKTGQAPEAK